jgi:hypothetical protein
MAQCLVMLLIFHVNVIICQIFKLVTWYLNMVQTKWMTWFNKLSTFIKIKNHLNYFWNIFVVFGAQIYSNLPLNKMKWNSFFMNILHRLYYNIICKNIMKFSQKFEVGYTQTCPPLETSVMWQPKEGHHNVFSPIRCNHNQVNQKQCWTIEKLSNFSNIFM